MPEQDLFDFNAPASNGMLDVRPDAGVRIPQVGALKWTEITQAAFLSLSVPMQLSYCARRDEDSATTAHLRGERPEFYLERAAAYREDLEALIHG